MTGTRTWPLEVVLSTASGVHLNSPFADTHELITELAGWPVLTHQLTVDAIWDGVRAKIVAQVPWVARAIEDLPAFDQDDQQLAVAQIEQFVGRIAAVHGPTVVLDAGEPLPRLPFYAGLEHLGGGETR